VKNASGGAGNPSLMIDSSENMPTYESILLGMVAGIIICAVGAAFYFKSLKRGNAKSLVEEVKNPEIHDTMGLGTGVNLREKDIPKEENAQQV